MATADAPNLTPAERERLRSDWLGRLDSLLSSIEGWAREQDWSTRRIEKKLGDPVIGEHRVPCLLLQKETVRLLVEPMGRTSVGAEGVVDFYRMPAYDDIARLWHDGRRWRVLEDRPEPDGPTHRLRERRRTLSRKVVEDLLERMMHDAG